MITLIIIIGLAVLILAHEFGHFIAAKIFNVKVEEFGIGYPPRIFGKQFGETLYSVNWLPLGGFVRIHGEDKDEEAEAHGKDETLDSLRSERSFATQALWKRAVILIAGVTMNMLVGWLIFSGIFATGIPAHLAIADVSKDSPAYTAGLTANDFIVGARLGTVVLNDPIRSEDFIAAMKKAAGSSVSLTILHEGKEKTLSILSRANPPEGEGSLGVALSDVGVEKVPLFSSFGKGFTAAITLFWLTLKGFFSLIIGLFSSPGTAMADVAGPVGVFSIATQTGKMGLVYLFQLIALISINLSVLNLIPFPALDGGRVLFLIIEKLKGSPVSYKTQRTVNAIGFAALILLMVFVTIHDVGNILHK